MLKLHKHFTLLTFFVLVLGLQTAKSSSGVYASTSNNEIVSSTVNLSIVYYKAKAKVHSSHAIELIAEMAEFDKEEEENTVETLAHRAISHAYFSSFLSFSLLDLYASKKRFDTPKNKVLNQLYLQFQVFRL
ncbi:hypothetical protein GH721_08590 [Kriegella sp. EG-1]|nr:hypothetical protein [Flavobacteriaceae bacterium EG-1]